MFRPQRQRRRTAWIDDSLTTEMTNNSRDGWIPGGEDVVVRTQLSDVAVQDSAMHAEHEHADHFFLGWILSEKST